MIYRLALSVGGWAAAALLMALYLSARDNLATEIEVCNTRVSAAAQAASEAARAAQASAHAESIAQLEKIVQAERQAREIAEQARDMAESRPDRVRTVIREVAGDNSCIDTAVPVELLNSLRD